LKVIQYLIRNPLICIFMSIVYIAIIYVTRNLAPDNVNITILIYK